MCSTEIGGNVSHEYVSWLARRLAASLVLIGACVIGVLTPSIAQAEQCGNEIIRLQQGSGELPECRAYELVTRFPKQGHVTSYGNNPLNLSGLTALSEDGDQITAISPGAGLNVLGQESSPFGSAIFLRRNDESGWNSESLNPPQSEFSDQKLLGSDANTGTSLWLLHTASTGLYVGDLYVRSNTGQFKLIGPEAPPSPNGSPAEPASLTMNEELGRAKDTDGVVGASKEFTDIVLQANTSLGGRFLWPGDETFEASGSLVTTNVGSLYEYAGEANAAPTLVGVEGGAGSTDLIGQCGTVLGTLKGTETAAEPNIVRNEISENGATVFFSPVPSDLKNENCQGKQPEKQELYARINRSETVDISNPSPSECDEDPECIANEGKRADASFEAASMDGSKVFFASTQQLLPGATEDAGVNDSAMVGCSKTEPGTSGCNLYEYDFDRTTGTRLALVSGGPNDAPVLNGARVQGVIGSSNDGSYVYFVAQGVLTGAEKNSNGEVAEEGKDNLYLYEPNPGQPGESVTTFIASLTPEDAGSLWEAKEIRRQAQVTPDGDFLVFASNGKLTKDDTSTGVQLFEYDALSRSLVRVSAGEMVEGTGYKEDGNISTAEESPSLNTGKAISNDGATVVFESKAGLSPRAIIASTAGCSNVYEYHWDKSEAITDGEVNLVSDGRDVVLGNGGGCGAKEGAVNGNGQDVTFETSDPLTWEDSDTLPDIYDARIDGGFLAPSSSIACEGDGCKGPVGTGTSGFGVPGSAMLSGTGNLPAPTSSRPAVSKAKGKTTAQRKAAELAGALKACKRRPKKKRSSCEKQARKRYGTKAKKSSRRAA
jgi:hypothetical protein